MPIAPYIHFQGNCRTAMTAYQQILGGDLEIMGYDQMPGAPTPLATSNRVMHSALMSPFGDIEASDFPPGVDGDPQMGVSIALEVPGKADAKRIYEALLQDGDVLEPFGENFFSPGFGMLKDRFGTHWIVMTTPAPA